MFRHTEASGLIECRNGSCGAPTSTAITSSWPSGVASAITTSTIETPMLPAATVRRPAARSIASSMSVVVVFPLVPVITSQGAAPDGRRSRQASSSSPQTGTPADWAATMMGDRGLSPGDTTSTSHTLGQGVTVSEADRGAEQIQNSCPVLLRGPVSRVHGRDPGAESEQRIGGGEAGDADACHRHVDPSPVGFTSQVRHHQRTHSA